MPPPSALSIVHEDMLHEDTAQTHNDQTLGKDQPPAQSSPVRLTPATSLALEDNKIIIPAGSYTRLSISSVTGSQTSQGAHNDNTVIYPYRTRSAIERFFVGKRHSASLSVTVDVGNFVATVPLVTVSHDSTRGGGENFNRVIRHEALDFPLFLVRGDGTSDIASASFLLKGSDSTESSISGIALSAVLAATKAVAGPPALMTTLSSASAKTLATSVDNSISKLFAMALSEQQILDQPVRQWRPATVTLRLPRREGNWNALNKDAANNQNATEDALAYWPIGTWTVTFDKPRISAFLPITITCPTPAVASDGKPGNTGLECNAAYDAAAKAAASAMASRYDDILSFALLADGNTTSELRAYLKQLDWWVGAVNALHAGDGDGAAAFCRQVRAATTRLGFNAPDSFIIIRAIAESNLVAEGDAPKLRNSPSCTGPDNWQ
jgi:hypothetical protein